MATATDVMLDRLDAAARPPSPHRFTVDEYHQLGAAGVLGPESRDELIEGEIIDMAPIGSLHAAVVTELTRLLIKQTPETIVVRSQNPIRLDVSSEPQPDLVLLSSRAEPYSKSHPGPADVLLLIEVSDTTLAYDRDRKVPLYARHGIPEVWLFDLAARQLTVYLEPSAEGYRKMLKPEAGVAITPVLVPELALDWAAVFEV